MSEPIVPPKPKVHPQDLPAWRLLFEVGKNSVGFFPERAFDDLICLSSGLGIESALVSDPEGLRHVLTVGASRYRRPTSFIRIARPLVGEGLFLAEGDTWRGQRKSLAPLFTPKALEHLLPHFKQASETLVETLKGKASANLSEAFQYATLDAVLRALFSTPPTSDQDGLTALMCRYVDGPGRLTPLDGLAKGEHDFQFFTKGRRQFARERTEAVGKLIAARRALGEAAESRDLLDLLMAARDDAGQPLPDEEIGAQATTFVFAGFETTARLLFWAAYLLTLDRAEQARIREEVKAFPPEKVEALADLNHWPRLRRTLLEAMRLYPPAPNMVRTAKEADEICGVKINPGTRVWISPWVVHRHRKLWEEPDAFIPDRFIDQPSPWATNGAYIPFGTGPRVCIGGAFAMAEAQILLATLLSKYDIALDTSEPVLPKGSITIAPAVEPQFELTAI